MNETQKQKLRNAQYWLAFVCLLGIWTGLFGMRALTSISTGVFVVNGFVFLLLNKEIGKFLKQPMLLAWYAFVAIQVMSLLWSNDLAEGWLRIVVKLPLLFFPLGMLPVLQMKKIHFVLLSFVIFSLLFGGCCWSYWQFAKLNLNITEFYHKAGVLHTPFDDSHIFFSLALAISCLMIVRLWPKLQQWLRIIAVCFAIVFVGFLFFMSAKTGLLALALGIVVLLITEAIRKKKYLLLLFGTIALSLTFAIAYHYVPSFRARMEYVFYDYEQYSKNNFLHGLSDGNRVRSVLVVEPTLKSNWLFGIGIGDVKNETMRSYAAQFPTMLDFDKILPSSQIVLSILSAGILGLISLLAMAILPFFHANAKRSSSWLALCFVLPFVWVYEIPFEGQIGVLLFVFYWNWWNAMSMVDSRRAIHLKRVEICFPKKVET
jgi:O-antigen ligase